MGTWWITQVSAVRFGRIAELKLVPCPEWQKQHEADIKTTLITFLSALPGVSFGHSRSWRPGFLPSSPFVSVRLLIEVAVRWWPVPAWWLGGCPRLGMAVSFQAPRGSSGAREQQTQERRRTVFVGLLATNGKHHLWPCCAQKGCGVMPESTKGKF